MFKSNDYRGNDVIISSYVWLEVEVEDKNMALSYEEMTASPLRKVCRWNMRLQSLSIFLKS